MTKNKDEATRAGTSEPQTEKQIRTRFLSLVHNMDTEKPRPADVDALSRMLSDHRGLELWRMIGGLTESAEATLLRHPSIPPALTACWKERLRQVRRDLGYADAPAVERLLIKHVALCWLRLNVMEHAHGLPGSGQHSMKEGLYVEKRLTAAQARYTRAVETLARVRALTAATRLIEARAESAGALKRVNRPVPVRAFGA